MRVAILGLLLLISVCGAQGGSRETMLRVSAGVGAGDQGFVADARGLVGWSGSPWRVGAQAMLMLLPEFFVTPNQEVSSIHLVAGRELVPSSPISITLFGGVGMSKSLLKGELIESSGGFMLTTDRYETIRSTDPSVLLGGDLSLSIHRHFGLSLQMGVQASRVTALYGTLQLDAGSW